MLTVKHAAKYVTQQYIVTAFHISKAKMYMIATCIIEMVILVIVVITPQYTTQHTSQLTSSAFSDIK